MTISHNSLYLLITVAVLTASVVQLVRGVPHLIVGVAALVFLSIGNGTVFLAGTRTRAARRQQKHDYWNG